jgi:hypothetical protein
MSDKTAPIVSISSPDTASVVLETKPSSEQGAFFPWLENDEQRAKYSPGILKRFPILGAVGLVGSALSVFFSWLVLRLFEHHEVINDEHLPLLPKPAVWLSIILSINSILVHLAVSNGIAVTWWYRASKKETTVADLHNVWAKGTSLIEAIIEWRGFNYVALTTIFVATLPANGILLQNAISGAAEFVLSTDTYLNVPIADRLPSGATATLNLGDGTVATFQPYWQSVMSNIISSSGGTTYITQPVLVPDSKSIGPNTCREQCYAKVQGIGFQSKCDTSTESYRFDVSNDSVPYADTILAVNVEWNSTIPYSIFLKTHWKDQATCQGDYHVETCELRLGTVNYPIWLDFNPWKQGQASQWTPTYTWQLSTDDDGGVLSDDGHTIYSDSYGFKAYPLDDMPIGPEVSSTTFGGIAASLGAQYNSSIVLKTAYGVTSLLIGGAYAQQTVPVAPTDACNISYNSFGSWSSNYSSMHHDVLDRIRTALFHTSIWAADNATGDMWPDHKLPEPQKVNISRQLDGNEEILAYNYYYPNRYTVKWFWWGMLTTICWCSVR